MNSWIRKSGTFYCLEYNLRIGSSTGVNIVSDQSLLTEQSRWLSVICVPQKLSRASLVAPSQLEMASCRPVYLTVSWPVAVRWTSWHCNPRTGSQGGCCSLALQVVAYRALGLQTDCVCLHGYLTVKGLSMTSLLVIKTEMNIARCLRNSSSRTRSSHLLTLPWVPIMGD